MQQNASTSEETASASEEMNAQAEQMKSIVEDLVSLISGKSRKNRPGKVEELAPVKSDIPTINRMAAPETDTDDFRDF